MHHDFPIRYVPAEYVECLTEDQKSVFEMYQAGMLAKDIAKARGVHRRNLLLMTANMRKRIRGAGYDPDAGLKRMTAPPFTIKGRSELVKKDEDGKESVVMFWNKTERDKQAMAEAVLAGIDAAAQSFKPLPPVKPRKFSMADLCTVYTLTDYHIGAYSWADETGADWDVKIAKEVMIQAFADMMLGSPDSEVAVFAQIGDFLHFDGLLALTPTSKNVLDADTRFPLIVQAAIELCLGVVDLLLHKHQSVHVIMGEGNHDLASSVWLRAIMAQAFKNNPRVTVEVSPFPFYSFKWGSTFLGWHHGHLQKMDQLPLLFATDPRFRSDYGQCTHTYIHTGHMHHQKVIDKGGIVVEQHPTLSARDAHGARGYLLSNRETKAITYHKEYGEKSRCTVRPVIEKKRAAA